MWLTKNEKKVLKLLIDNGKLSDTSIANKLNISSQAIGRIRKKLEEDIIERYTLVIDPSKINLHVIIGGKINVNPTGRELKREILEKLIIENPHIISLYKILGRDCYFFSAAFRDLDDFHNFLNLETKDGKIQKFLDFEDVYPIPSKCILKKDEIPLFNKMIDELGTKATKIAWKEK